MRGPPCPAKAGAGQTPPVHHYHERGYLAFAGQHYCIDTIHKHWFGYAVFVAAASLIYLIWSSRTNLPAAGRVDPVTTFSLGAEATLVVAGAATIPVREFANKVTIK
jgi:hypothetical protein